MTPLRISIIRDVSWSAQFNDFVDALYEPNLDDIYILLDIVKYEIWDAVQDDIMSGDAQ